jgi:hypothetical protein
MPWGSRSRFTLKENNKKAAWKQHGAKVHARLDIYANATEENCMGQLRDGTPPDVGCVALGSVNPGPDGSDEEGNNRTGQNGTVAKWALTRGVRMCLEQIVACGVTRCGKTGRAQRIGRPPSKIHTYTSMHIMRRSLAKRTDHDHTAESTAWPSTRT